jgi:hypothetical protein
VCGSTGEDRELRAGTRSADPEFRFPIHRQTITQEAFVPTMASVSFSVPFKLLPENVPFTVDVVVP